MTEATLTLGLTKLHHGNDKTGEFLTMIMIIIIIIIIIIMMMMNLDAQIP